MTPKEKAKELYNKLNPHCLIKNYYGDDVEVQSTKQCAILAVDEILNNFGSKVGDKTHYCNYLTIQYYEEVKQEIENL